MIKQAEYQSAKAYDAWRNRLETILPRALPNIFFLIHWERGGDNTTKTTLSSQQQYQQDIEEDALDVTIEWKIDCDQSGNDACQT
jgi:hypothetical protein